MVQYLPAPTHLIYLVLGVIFVRRRSACSSCAETMAPRSGALASLRPRLAFRRRLRGRRCCWPFRLLVATWALVGFYGSLAPTLVRTVLGFASLLPSGLALFALAGSGGIAVILLRQHEPRTIVSLGAFALLAGVGTAIVALSLRSAVLFYMGTAISGAGFGAAFQGAVRNVIPHAQPSERAGVLSVIFVVSYLAMGLPAVIAGTLIVEQGNVLTTATEFGAVVMFLAALALLGTMRKTSR